MKRLAIIALVPMLTGAQTMCSKELPPVAIDTYCINAKYRYWSPDDTDDTIQAIEIQNRTIEKRCSRKT